MPSPSWKIWLHIRLHHESFNHPQPESSRHVSLRTERPYAGPRDTRRRPTQVAARRSQPHPQKGHGKVAAAFLPGDERVRNCLGRGVPGARVRAGIPLQEGGGRTGAGWRGGDAGWRRARQERRGAGGVEAGGSGGGRGAHPEETLPGRPGLGASRGLPLSPNSRPWDACPLGVSAPLIPNGDHLGPSPHRAHRPWSRPGPSSAAARPILRSPRGEARAARTDHGTAQQPTAPPADLAALRAQPTGHQAPLSSAPEAPRRGGPVGEKGT
ncbi:uncharacterized protein LOC141567341 [Rhinolophus sinicus]|uniref:uncharacterized protein LOC141567341 n=1 Tax=Rhinolophus sinicus TaxID=89399 RepID=UPI003D79E7D4